MSFAVTYERGGLRSPLSYGIRVVSSGAAASPHPLPLSSPSPVGLG